MLSFFANRLEGLPFHESYAPTYVVSKILGLLPYSRNSIEDKSGKKIPEKTVFSFSFALSLITILWAISYVISYVLANESVLAIPSSRNYPIISVVGHLMHIYLGICIFITSYIFTPRKIYRYNVMSIRMDFLDSELTSICGKSVDYRTTVIFQYFFIVGGALLVATAFLFDYFVFMDMYGNYMIIICFAYVYPYVCSGVIHLQFIAIVHSIYQRFKAINTFLQHIADINVPTSNAALQMKLKSAQTEKPEKTNPDTKQAFVSNSSLPANAHMRLNEIFILHDKLCDASESINDIFSLQIVSSITAGFIIIIFGFFIETKVAFWAWGQNVTLILIATSYVIWGAINCLSIYVMLSCTTNAKETANAAALVVHKILQNKPAFMLNDEIYYNKMKSFTLQILHRKNTFHFNALGLFRLDYTFIFSAVSAATSYLIVLLQFDLTDYLVAFDVMLQKNS
ncbi:gustatory and pheromone receptor 33a [Phlebotomus argentipes]|uniref:gustatory and pheromone receptor 33a n=1 Tax=Phlebotomus argentipes TaxID=94469 RepID=UPI002892FD18|nr:gustatory and pheromone receptor 33a [Phlebotomus argentipes]